MTASFEWDPRKAASNFRRHGVSFEEAVGVFSDPLARIFEDEDHAVDERREIIIRALDAGAPTANLIHGARGCHTNHQRQEGDQE